MVGAEMTGLEKV